MDKTYKLWELSEGKVYKRVDKGQNYRIADGKLTRCVFEFDENISLPYSTIMLIEFALVEPEIDWSKVPVDTKVLVKNCGGVNWTNRYFSNYKNDEVYAFCDGATSWTASGEASWGTAKLAEDNPAYYKEV